MSSMIHAIAWKNDCLELLDQTQLPGTTCYLQLRHIDQVFEAIRGLKVRGAPAIGVAAVYGLYLGVHHLRLPSLESFHDALREQIRYLASARPTAANLRWALEETLRQLISRNVRDVEASKRVLLELAIALQEDDRRRCERIADHGQTVISQHARILTHCNTGALATAGIGTALGVICRANALGKNIEVYACETRPVLQGARLTMWELEAARIRSHLICDSMAAALMRAGKVDVVIVGADRIAADGSVANKIGTYSLAISAKYHHLPFYVAAPFSTFDPSVRDGEEIPIEERSQDEVRRVLNQLLITLPQAQCWNPAFDVTPPELITALITERGIVSPPFREAMANLLAAG